MVLTLDAALEQRIQRQLDRGAFREQAELLAHALDLIAAETAEEGWLQRNREAIHTDLDRTFGQASRGEGHASASPPHREEPYTGTSSPK